jgi:hypothetical protein
MIATPGRYRKKPVVIEAMHWDGTAAGATPIIDWILESGGTARYVTREPMLHSTSCRCDGRGIVPGSFAASRLCPETEPTGGGDPYLAIDTLEGTMAASSGDAVIRGVKGEFYPCRADIMAATYERVEEDLTSDGESHRPMSDAPITVAPEAKVKDLMAALEESLAAAKAKKAAGR